MHNELKYLTLAEVAQLLLLDQKQTRRLAKAGKLPGAVVLPIGKCFSYGCQNGQPGRLQVTPDIATEGELLLSAQEVGTLLGVNRSTVWTWHASGKIPAPLRIGGTTRWRRREIERWLEAGAPPRERWTEMQADGR